MKLNKLLSTLAATLLLFSVDYKANCEIKNLQLQQKSLTTKTNIVIPSVVASLQINDVITLHTSDLKKFTGHVTKVDETPEAIKISGIVHNSDKTMFGFMMNKNGDFQGCITNENQTIWYVMELDINLKGYLFYKKLKFDKTI
jgi:hypothetical protein